MNGESSKSGSGSYDLFKDGILDKGQLNYILKNPEEPKCKYTVSSLLKLYQDERRKALTIARCSGRNVSESDSDMEAVSEAQVKLSSLPKELFQKIIEEAIAKNQSTGKVKADPVEVKREPVADEDMEESAGSSYENQDSLLSETLKKARRLAEVSDAVEEKRTRNTHVLLKEYETVLKNEDHLRKLADDVGKELQIELKKLMDSIKLCESIKGKQAQISKEIESLETKKAELQKEILSNVLAGVGSLSENSTSSNDRKPGKASHSSKKVPSSNFTDEGQSTTFAADNYSGESAAAKKKAMSALRNKMQTLKMDMKNKVLNKEVEECEKLLKEYKSAKKELKVLTNSFIKMRAEKQSESTERGSENVTGSETAEVDFSKQSKEPAWKSNYVTVSLGPRAASISTSQRTSEDSDMASIEAIPQTFTSEKDSKNESPRKNTSKKSSDSDVAKKSGDKDLGRKTNEKATPKKPSEMQADDSVPKSEDGRSSNTQAVAETTSPNPSNISYKDAFGRTCFYACYGANIHHTARAIRALQLHKGYLYVGIHVGQLRRFNIADLSYTEYKGHNNRARCISINPDTDQLYVGSEDGMLYNFDAPTGALKNSYYLGNRITCLEQGKAILFIGLANGTVHRLGLLADQIVNSFCIGTDSVVAMKTVASDSEKQRLVVSCATDLSIRDAQDGSLLTVICHQQTCLLGVVSQSSVVFIHWDERRAVSMMGIYDEKYQKITSVVPISANAKVLKTFENHLYIGTHSAEIYYYRYDVHGAPPVFVSIYLLPHPSLQVTSLLPYADVIIVGTLQGKIYKVCIEKGNPYRCHYRGCEGVLARKVDMENHFKFVHCANANRGDLFSCRWRDCQDVVSCSEIFHHFSTRHLAETISA